MRIPNETLIKSEVTTLTKFPIRRMDLQIGVAYKEDIARVRETLADVADRNPLCLEEPPPLYIFQGFGDSALNMQFSVWATRENFLELKNTIHEEIKAAFDAGTPEDCHSALHGIGHLIGHLSESAAKSNLSTADQDEVKAAAEKLMSAFGKVDQHIHGIEDGAEYVDVAAEIDEAIATLQAKVELTPEADAEQGSDDPSDEA